MIVRIPIGVLTMAATLATATAASAHDESKYPDWSGQWRWNAMGGGPRYDPSKPAGAAQQAPLKEEFKRIHEENMAEQAQGGQGLYAATRLAHVCKWTAGLLRWAGRPFHLPLTEEGRQLYGRVRGWGTSGTGGPSPMNQLVIADMARNRLDAASAIELRILDL
jgi:hypothetical protein